MGFNLSVCSNYPDADVTCAHYIKPTFYNFVVSGDMYGDESILIQSGRYFGIDLSPLLVKVYTNGDVSEQEIIACIQNTDFLLDLATTFREHVYKDNMVSGKIKYTWSDAKKEMAREPDPWKWYFKEGQLLEDLDNLIKSLKCYSEKGITEVFLAAG